MPVSRRSDLDGLFALVDGLHSSLFPPRELPVEEARALLVDFAQDEGLAA